MCVTPNVDSNMLTFLQKLSFRLVPFHNVTQASCAEALLEEPLKVSPLSARKRAGTNHLSILRVGATSVRLTPLLIVWYGPLVYQLDRHHMHWGDGKSCSPAIIITI
jgi:hypothetical protein